MPAVLPASRGVRVAGEVLVVPPFECAWLSGEGSEPSGDGGSVSFEAKGQSDVTVMLKPRGAPTRRLDHWSGRLDGAAASDEPAQDDDVAQGPVTTEQQSAAADSQEAEAGHVLDLPDIDALALIPG